MNQDRQHILINDAFAVLLELGKLEFESLPDSMQNRFIEYLHTRKKEYLDDKLYLDHEKMILDKLFRLTKSAK